jgi:hypothetical protein
MGVVVEVELAVYAQEEPEYAQEELFFAKGAPMTRRPGQRKAASRSADGDATAKAEGMEGTKEVGCSIRLFADTDPTPTDLSKHSRERKYENKHVEVRRGQGVDYCHRHQGALQNTHRTKLNNPLGRGRQVQVPLGL